MMRALSFAILAIPMGAVNGPAAALGSEPGYRVESVASGLVVPSSLAFLPDGSLLVAERAAGRLSRLDPVSGTRRILSGLPDMVTGQDAGLHEVRLHPQYETDGNGWIYFTYSAGDTDNSTLALDRARLVEDRLVDRERLFTANAYTPDRYHYGGRLAFRDGFLFLTVGDRHRRELARRMDSHAGKILRLEEDGSAPDDNPFTGDDTALPEIWTLGHRNPQGLAFHPVSGELWSHEHGPKGGDELNRIERGADYGWPRVTWGFEYDGGAVGEGIASSSDTNQPVQVWSPAVAPSDLLFASGGTFARWRGSLFIGAMSRMLLLRLEVRAGKVVLEERMLAGAAGRIRALAEAPGGSIYLASDDGVVRRLIPSDAPLSQPAGDSP